MKSHVLVLYLKELRASKLTLVVFPLAIAIVQIWMGAYDRIPREIAAGLAWTPFAVYPFIAIASGYQAFRSEWHDKTVYLLGSLPIPGWKVAGAKLAATMTAFTINSLVTIAGAVILMERFLAGEPEISGFHMGMVVSLAVKGYIGYWLVIAGLAILGQFSYLAGRLVERYNVLVSACGLFVAVWLTERLGSLLAMGLEWLPRIHVTAFSITNGIMSNPTFSFSPAPFVGALLVLAGLFIAGSIIFEQVAEV